MVGAGGASGKTTMTYLLEAAPGGRAGALKWRTGPRISTRRPHPARGPGPPALSAMVGAGTHAVAMECSSDDLDHYGVGGTRVRAVVLTNFSPSTSTTTTRSSSHTWRRQVCSTEDAVPWRRSVDDESGVRLAAQARVPWWPLATAAPRR
ncbi:MAG: Mur ligase family protein [Acidimicrobiales bacterium]